MASTDVVDRGHQTADFIDEEPRDPIVAVDGIAVRWLREFGPASAQRTGGRLISFDPRTPPGSHLPARSVTDLVDEIGELVDRLGFSRFFLVAAFSGSRYALETAARFGHRVLAMSLINPDLPWIASPSFSHRCAQYEWSGQLRGQMEVFRSNPEPTLRSWEPLVAPEDLPALRRHRVRRFVIDELLTAFSNPEMVEAETERLMSPLNCDLHDITAEVTIWHGKSDPLHPIEASRKLADALPQFRIVEIPRSGALWFVRDDSRA